MEYKGKYEFIPKGIPWPQDLTFLVGVGNGYHAFELEEDFEAFLAQYREDHKNDKPTSSSHYYSSDSSDELPRTGAIGFAA